MSEQQAEARRLAAAHERTADWQRWGPYLAERQWGTVREDYSPDGSCWSYFPHDHARSRAYRWGEDGLLGFTDRGCRLCFGLALWNGRDPILKERLYGLNSHEGNHAEDAKELWYYLDSSPTHSYVRMLYKYPQAAFPYAQLLHENRRRNRHEPEYELEDTGVFDENRYFDVLAEYAKKDPNDILIRLTVTNRGPDAAPIHLLPMLWFRNTWSWGCEHEGCALKPSLEADETGGISASHDELGHFVMAAGPTPQGEAPPLLFTENETNQQRLFNVDNAGPYVKDAFHRYLIDGQAEAVNPDRHGTRAALHYQTTLAAGDSLTVRLRLTARDEQRQQSPWLGFDQLFAQRRRETDAYMQAALPAGLGEDAARVARQAAAGLLCSKTFYHYSITHWLAGDPAMPAPPPERRHGRNHQWRHLFNRDLIAMPDKWEYPWYAAWDLAFHMIPMARLDPGFAKHQLLLFLREWYMHPNGQLPAYEFAFDDVNPPVHAWACWRVYQIGAEQAEHDYHFLARCFHKLLLNFTWWVNRKDEHGDNLFSGGFLGLDNIGIFDRSADLPGGGHLQQADGTAWMAFYCGTMLTMAIELASHDSAYEDVASKFFEHFIGIVDAINTLGHHGIWDDEDGFYYDLYRLNDHPHRLKVRSMVGIIPLFAVHLLQQEVIERLPGFLKRMDWFLEHRKDLARHIAYCQGSLRNGHIQYLLAVPPRERLIRVLARLLDPEEFLSPYGIRSLSRWHQAHPFALHLEGRDYSVDYSPGESTTDLFGGNSNWRGPVWFPLNYLLIESLESYDAFYGDDLKVECPTGSGTYMTLGGVARELAARLSGLFLQDDAHRRPCHGSTPREADPHWRDLILFHEYFHGETGKGLGASHQTGWTALVIDCLARTT